MRLGRLPHSPQAVAGAPKLGARMERVPLVTRCDRTAKLYEPILGGNDRLPDCHDDRTEVLTSRGWQLWAAYDGAPVATLNRVTRHLEFQEPLTVQRAPYSGPMLCTEHKSLDFCVTPNHRMLCRTYSIPKPYVRGTSSYGAETFVRANRLSARVAIPGAPSGFDGRPLEPITIGARLWDGDDLVALTALVVSDGWVGSTPANEGRVSFCCFRDDRRQVVSDFAKKIGVSEQVSRPGVWVWRDPALAAWLHSNAYTTGQPGALTKCVPCAIRNASQRQISLFLQFFGDQHERDGGSRFFYSSSKRLIDDLQEMLLKTGRRSTIYRRAPEEEGRLVNGRPIRSNGLAYVLYEWSSERDVVLYRSSKLGRPTYQDDYVGEVFCATVPNGTLITRRNGRTLISGNCTAVAIANAALGFAVANGGLIAVEDAAIEGFYAATVGVPVADIASTNGAVLLDAMRRQCRVGMPDKSGQVLLTGPFGTIEPTDRRLLAAATAILGPIILGVDLTMAEQQPGVWDLARPSADQPWGGHALVLYDFVGIDDEDQVRLATWGALQAATWRWLYAQCREAYAVVWPDLLGPSGKQWDGLDRPGLAADVVAWTAT